MTLIYKIVSRMAWQDAKRQGRFDGAAIDLQDGYIHLSTGEQVRETARRHFAGQADLLLVTFREAKLAEKLKWETSRGGALFPHYYGTLDPAAAEDTIDLIWDGTQHVFPSSVS